MTEEQNSRYSINVRRWGGGLAIERKGRLPEPQKNLQVRMEEQIIETMTRDTSLKDCTYSFEIKFDKNA